MKTRRLLTLFVLASLAGHALVLALTTRVGWQNESPPRPPHQEILNVHLKPPPVRPQREPQPPVAPPAAVAPLKEETVALQGRGGPYEGYLVDVRRRIERIWLYPPQALALEQEGEAVIQFTIDAAGQLALCRVTGSSGSPLLDEGALAVVRAAAPYKAFPPDFPIARLNITATFRYELGLQGPR